MDSVPEALFCTLYWTPSWMMLFVWEFPLLLLNHIIMLMFNVWVIPLSAPIHGMAVNWGNVVRYGLHTSSLSMLISGLTIRYTDCSSRPHIRVDLIIALKGNLRKKEVLSLIICLECERGSMEAGKDLGFGSGCRGGGVHNISMHAPQPLRTQRSTSPHQSIHLQHWICQIHIVPLRDYKSKHTLHSLEKLNICSVCTIIQGI